ncbi:MAG: hypothetical protein H6739_00805 [Alphaproteobacteria bacterium]|nr:hypothetical protein [Alphaproteobacteria bacterium]
MEELRASLPPLSPDDPARQGQQLARLVRRRLGIGERAIDSMHDLLVQRLGVEVLHVTPEDLDPDIDGACTSWPTPVVLVNLIGGARCWWRTRASLGHELAHLLVDRDFLDGCGDVALVSPRLRKTRRAGRRPSSEGGFLGREQRAGAFAAWLLAPEQGIRDLVSDINPTDTEAIVRVSRHFGVGLELAVNNLTNTFYLSPDVQQEMLNRRVPSPLPAAHADAEACADGLRHGRLRLLTLRALREGHIDTMAAREILDLPLWEPFPVEDGLPPDLADAVMSRDELLRKHVQAYLLTRWPVEGLVPTEVTPTHEGAWTVRVGRYVDPEHAEPVGAVIVGPGLRIVDGRLPALGESRAAPG